MRFLGLYAHPDDETFCTGGTFARYAERGAEITVISATRGQAGAIRDAGVATRRTIGVVRDRELQQACEHLGVNHARCLDYADGALALSDLTPLTRELTAAIREYRPHAVFTFGPDGGYGHPDHIAISEAATVAWESAADAARFPEQIAAGLRPHAPDSLYYACFPRHRRRLLDRMARWLVNQDQRFRGDVGFVTALLHIAEEARDLGTISDHIETRWFPAGTFVIEQGEKATTLFLILSGEADVVREHADGSLETLGTLGPGEFFGELGIAFSRPRNAHVIARGDVTCLQFAAAEPSRFLGRGAGAHLSGAHPDQESDDEAPEEATTRIDVGEVIAKKIAAIAAYRSQYAFRPELIPEALLRDVFGVEYFVRARPSPQFSEEII